MPRRIALAAAVLWILAGRHHRVAGRRRFGGWLVARLSRAHQRSHRGMATRVVDREGQASQPGQFQVQGRDQAPPSLPVSSATAESAVLAPETLEGWYAVHQVWRVDRSAIRRLSSVQRREVAGEAGALWSELAPGSRGEAADPQTGCGWSAVSELVGSRGDLMVLHFRPTLDDVGEAERRFAGTRLLECLVPVTTFLSVTEAGLYHITAAIAAARRAAGGEPGDAAYREEVATRAAAERRNPHVARRLYPPCRRTCRTSASIRCPSGARSVRTGTR